MVKYFHIFYIFQKSLYFFLFPVVWAFQLSVNLSLTKNLNIIKLLSFVKMLPRGFLAFRISRQFGSTSSVQNALSLCLWCSATKRVTPTILGGMANKGSYLKTSPERKKYLCPFLAKLSCHWFWGPQGLSNVVKMFSFLILFFVFRRNCFFNSIFYWGLFRH